MTGQATVSVAGALLVMVAAAAAQDLPIRRPLTAETALAVDKAVVEEIDRARLIGVAVGIVQAGEITYLKGFGQANREKDVPVSTETVFNWAANSHPVTAVLAMQLVEQARLDLDLDVRKYVPEFPRKSAVITTRHLLTHQSGLPRLNGNNNRGTVRTYPVPEPFRDPILALDKFNQSDLQFPPGTKMMATDSGYMLLSAVIERAGEAEFARQVQDRVVTPLGLKSFQWDEPFEDQVNWAAGYYRHPSSGKIIPEPGHALYWLHGAGAFKSNITDFARWAEALLGDKLVSERSQRLMWSRHKLFNGREGFGFGFIVEEPGRRIVLNGKHPESRSRLLLLPEKKAAIVVLCNCAWANVTNLTDAIEKALGDSR